MNNNIKYHARMYKMAAEIDSERKKYWIFAETNDTSEK